MVYHIVCDGLEMATTDDEKTARLLLKYITDFEKGKKGGVVNDA